MRYVAVASCMPVVGNVSLGYPTLVDVLSNSVTWIHVTLLLSTSTNVGYPRDTFPTTGMQLATATYRMAVTSLVVCVCGAGGPLPYI